MPKNRWSPTKDGQAPFTRSTQVRLSSPIAPIDRSNPSEKGFITSAKLGDDLILSVFLNGSFENAFRKKGKHCNGPILANSERAL